MNIMNLIAEVADININYGNLGLFVWGISPEYGGIGRDRSVGEPDWNYVPGFSSESEMILALARLKVKVKYELGGESPEAG